MYKLLIVEDEDNIRNGLAKSVPWNEMGYEICGLAKNGIEALNCIELSKPDVVLTDIRMPIMDGSEFEPIMDGLELTRIINERYKEIYVVILTGFADFDYARQAIKLNVYEYLLKASDKRKIMSTFQNLRIKMDEEYLETKRQTMLSYQVKEGLEKYKEYFLNTLLEGEYTMIFTLEDRLNSLELSLDGNYFCVCSLFLETPQNALGSEWANNKNLLKFCYKNIISELLDVTGCGEVYVSDINKISIIFSFESLEQQEKQMLGIVNNSITYINQLILNNKAKLYAGLGSTYSNVMNVHTSYLESQKALDKRFFWSLNTIFTYDKDSVIENEKRLIKGYREESDKIVTAILNGQTDEVQSLLDMLFSSFSSDIRVQDIKNYYYVLCFLLKSSLAEFELSKEFPEYDFENFINDSYNMEELNNYVHDMFITTSELMAQKNDDDWSFKQKVIEEVKRYIEQNYKENLSLKKIGSHVHLSPSYISFLFKVVTGETYTDYLKFVRIKNAKTLLSRIDLKIYEIAEKVGYNNYKYFTLQFKKITGMSPTDYRDNLKL